MKRTKTKLDRQQKIREAILAYPATNWADVKPIRVRDILAARDAVKKVSVPIE